MDQNVERFNEYQLKRSGFAEAITPDLKEKMNKGASAIEHPFSKQYEGDRVDAVLHLKKSATADFYFLNKFDLQLQKEGQAESVKQTFYITRKKETPEEENAEQKQKLTENRYTLKEAYNLLAGRPVFKHLIDKEGTEYEAWVKLNFKNKLENGNFEMKQYHKNYGFELENTLSKYPIKELINQQYKDNLVESLQRGNSQKVTFVAKDGSEEKLYISPNITLGALNVYDQNKQRLSTEQLLAKDYIGKELAAELVSRIGHENKQKPDSKEEQKQQQQQQQQPSIKVDQKQSQQHKHTLKQENQKAEKKQTRKQKIK